MFSITESLYAIYDFFRSAPQNKATTQPIIDKSSGEPSSKVLDVVKKAGIFATFPLPLSSRGVLINVFKAPVRLFQSLSEARSKVLKDKTAVFGKVFKKTLKDHLMSDWKGGISDYYKRIGPHEVKANNTLKHEIAENVEFYEKIYKEDNPEVSYLSAWLQIFGRIPDASFESKITSLGFKKGKENCFYSEKTGSCFRLSHNPNEKRVVIGMMGLLNEGQAAGEKLAKPLLKRNIKAILHNFFGGIHANVTEAIELGNALKQACESSDTTLVIAGHSHGGMLAQCAAAANGIKASVFNSEPMGAGVRRYIRSKVGHKEFHKNAENITAFSVRGECLGGTRVFNVLSVWAERILGIPVPRTVAGKAYSIQSPKGKSALKLHFTCAVCTALNNLLPTNSIKAPILSP